MLKRTILLLFFGLSLMNLIFCQNSMLIDTTYKINSKISFNINISITSNEENSYLIRLKNIGKSDLYILNSNSTNEDQTISPFCSDKSCSVYIGQYLNSLDDIEYYKLKQLKKKQEIVYKAASSDLNTEIFLSIVTNKNKVKKQKGQFLIPNSIYFEVKKTFRFVVSSKVKENH